MNVAARMETTGEEGKIRGLAGFERPLEGRLRIGGTRPNRSEGKGPDADLVPDRTEDAKAAARSGFSPGPNTSRHHRSRKISPIGVTTLNLRMQQNSTSEAEAAISSWLAQPAAGILGWASGTGTSCAALCTTARLPARFHGRGPRRDRARARRHGLHNGSGLLTVLRAQMDEPTRGERLTEFEPRLVCRRIHRGWRSGGPPRVVGF